MTQPGFDYPRDTELWQPVHPVLAAASAQWKTDALRNVGVLFMLARLKPGVTPAMAAEQWTRANARLQSALPGFRFDLTATPFLEHQIGPARRAIWILFAAAGVLLLIACANVSGLMLTRVAERHREDAVRLAIGASRSAVGWQSALEALLLAVIGGTIGLLVSHWFLAAIIALAPAGIPRLDEVAINVPVALFSFGMMGAVSVLCGLAPVRQTGAVNLAATLNDGSRTIAGSRSLRARSALLAFQVAMSVVLLIAAGLVVRSFGQLQRIDLGFNPEGVLTLKVEPRAEKPPVNEMIRELLARVAALPPVGAAGAVSLMPLELGAIGQGTWVLKEDQPDTPESKRQNPILNYQAATPGYFRAMNISLKRGRLFEHTDVATAPTVAIISERTASSSSLVWIRLANASGCRCSIARTARQARRAPSWGSWATSATAASTRCCLTSTIRRPRHISTRRASRCAYGPMSTRALWRLPRRFSVKPASSISEL